MRVLFLYSSTEDYQSSSLFHGLRSILGRDCVDVPRFDVMYDTLSTNDRQALRGKGFSLYGLLPDISKVEEMRINWQKEIGQYDLVIFSSVWRQLPLLYHPVIQAAWHKVVLVDGEDFPALFPYNRLIRSFLKLWLMRLRTRPYFKREWFGAGYDYGRFATWLPSIIRRRLSSPTRVRPISFALPAEKVANFSTLKKNQDFTTHVVDSEVADALKAFHSQVGSDKYVFETEPDYYADLQKSRFGVTMKRGGWDCLRHYELAANGCVLCFRDLDLKPVTCAPHGLDATNCISYNSADELFRRIHELTEYEYRSIQHASRQWIDKYTTTALAKRFLLDALSAI
jgi:hypothetical protein